MGHCMARESIEDQESISLKDSAKLFRCETDLEVDSRKQIFARRFEVKISRVTLQQ